MMIDYRSPGPMTDLRAVPNAALATLALDPFDICAPIHSQVVQPSDPAAAGLSGDRLAENQIRPAHELVARLLALDPAPLSVGREPSKRVVGTCRHFAVLACAFLRYRSIASRVRCGFATYFQPGQAVDHWIVEYRTTDTDRWIRLDPEVMGQRIVECPEDLQSGQFLSGAEAWRACRRGEIDPTRFGVHGTENWGAAEIRGNAVKDLAALNKIEMLPWDEWGRMTDAYEGNTGEDYDVLLDELADTCAGDDSAAIARFYEHPDLRVPAILIR